MTLQIMIDIHKKTVGILKLLLILHLGSNLHFFLLLQRFDVINASSLCQFVLLIEIY